MFATDCRETVTNILACENESVQNEAQIYLIYLTRVTVKQDNVRTNTVGSFRTSISTTVLVVLGEYSRESSK